MKRWSLIIAILILIMAGLLWVRNTKDHLVYDFNIASEGYLVSDYYPLINNYIISEEISDKTLFKVKASNDFLSLNYWSNNSLKDIILGNTLNYERLLDRIYAFIVIDKFLYTSGLTYNKNHKTESTYFIINLENGHTSKYSSRERFRRDLNLKNAYTEDYEFWSKKWKKEGRLPWFPEHVGK